MRKTKIIVTIGPSSNDEETLSRLIADGMDCARLNFSHGTHEEHAAVIERIRRLSREHNRTVGILQDLGGIKLRLGRLDEAYPVNVGEEIVITPDRNPTPRASCPFPSRECCETWRLDTSYSSPTAPFSLRLQRPLRLAFTAGPSVQELSHPSRA